MHGVTPKKVVIPAHAGIQYAATSRLNHQRLWNTGSPAFAGDDEHGLNLQGRTKLRTHLRVPAARFARAFAKIFRPTKGVGNAGCQCTRSRACSVVNTRVSHHGYTGSPGIPARNGFNGFLRALPPATGLVCHRRLANESAKLDTSVGVSGPHDFAVRISAIRQRHIRIHRIPPRVRDDRDTPLGWDGMAAL